MKKTGHKPEFTEEDALAFFARHLDGLNWKYHRLPEAPVLFSGFNGKDVLWDFNMIDLPELRALALLAEKACTVLPAKSLDILRRDQKVLEEQINSALKKVEQLESQPPFTLREHLEDAAWRASRREEIEQQASALRQQAAGLNAHWEKLLTNSGYETTFGQN